LNIFSKKKLSNFKSILKEQLQSLLNEAGKTLVDMTGEVDTFPDPTDRASLESNRNFLLRIRDRERKLITKIKSALNRIENGEYGICEVCDEEISEERLKARPVTTLCIECKERQETQENSKKL
jgi:DnaK suppressor protein